MPLPERVLIDTSAFYALISANDDFHQQARQTYESLIDREQEMWTTSYILVEMAALVHRRLGFDPLRIFMEVIEPVVQVFWVDHTVHNAAWRQLVASRGAGLGLVDRTTALAAGHLRAHVFTFDRGFARQGIPVVPK